MKPRLNIPRDTLLKGLDAVFSLAVLPLATYSDYKDAREFLLFNVLLFAALCVARIFQALRQKEASRSYTWSLIKAGVFLLCGVLLLVIPDKENARQVIGILLTVMLLVEILVFVIRKHTFRSLFFNGACVLTLLLVIKGDYYRVQVYILVQVLTHIFLLSFSQFNLKVLLKIIKKTHAADVLAGQLLLMTAASFMIPSLEESIPTFKDAVWYCFSILTNIGFANYAAASDAGKVISVLLGMYSIIVVSLVTSIIVNFYTEVKDEPDREEDNLPV